MALLPYLKKEQLPPADQDAVLLPMHIYELLAHNPETARAMIGLGSHIRVGKTLGEYLKEMLILQVGFTTGCAYEYSHHLKIAERDGIAEKDIHAVARETAGETTHLDERTRLGLKAAREITTSLRCSDDTSAALLKHYSPEQLIDLTVTVGFYNMIVRFLETLRIDVEEAYLPYLKKYPLAA
ncbi:MAG: carboxymuconolactone decarboxylase family protein [Pseudomonadota bacterium]